MRVKMLDPARANLEIMDELEEAASRVLRSGQYISGVEVEKFEHACCEYLNISHAIACSSGTDALLMSLMAYGIGPGDEVICPSFTFAATAEVIERVGATPVFCDVALLDNKIMPFTSVRDIKAKITSKTRAIIPVHIFGYVVSDVYPVDIPVIEDACQAFGSRAGSRFAGTMEDVGCFSFFPSKNLGGFGDGGMVVTNDSSLAKILREIRNHGSSSRYDHVRIGGNFRMDELQAALLSVQLKTVDARLEKRKELAGIYDQIFSAHNHLWGAHITKPNPHGGCTYNQYTIRVSQSKRNTLMEYLCSKGIDSAVYYPVPLHRQACFSHLKTGRLQRTEHLCGCVLSLPISDEHTEEEIRYVADHVTKFFKEVS